MTFWRQNRTYRYLLPTTSGTPFAAHNKRRCGQQTRSRTRSTSLDHAVFTFCSPYCWIPLARPWIERGRGSAFTPKDIELLQCGRRLESGSWCLALLADLGAIVGCPARGRGVQLGSPNVRDQTGWQSASLSLIRTTFVHGRPFPDRRDQV